MFIPMKRIPEPERMTAVEEFHYAQADYSQPHNAFVQDVFRRSARVSASPWQTSVGTGDILLRLKRAGVDWRLYGLDSSERMLGHARRAEAAKKQGGRRAFQSSTRRDIKHTNLPAASDAIISNSVLHHLEDAVKFWREVARLGKPGAGRPCSRRACALADKREANAIIARHVSHLLRSYRSTTSFLQSAYTLAEVEAQLARARIAGLSVRKVEGRYLDVSGRLMNV